MISFQVPFKQKHIIMIDSNIDLFTLVTDELVLNLMINIAVFIEFMGANYTLTFKHFVNKILTTKTLNSVFGIRTD